MEDQKLRDIFALHGSNKTVNGYAETYENLFSHLRDKDMTLIEIGTEKTIPEVLSPMNTFAQPGYSPGGSLRSWRDFFKKGMIHGVDAKPDNKISEERITTHICSSIDRVVVDNLKETDNFPNEADIIINTGDHSDQAQLATLKNFFHLVKKGGYYIVEDTYDMSPMGNPYNPQIREIIGNSYMYPVIITDPYTWKRKVPISVIKKV